MVLMETAICFALCDISNLTVLCVVESMALSMVLN